MTDELILEWIKETCDAYCISKPFAIVEALEAARATAEQPEPDALLRAFKRIEELRKGLFQARDAMRVMSDWVKKSDPAGHSWAVRMVDLANDVLSHKSQQDAAIESKPTEQSAWQPIATAPPEGQFLVYMPDEHRQPIQVAKWHPNVKVIGNAFAFDLAPPTHWMPLPATPVESQRSGDGS